MGNNYSFQQPIAENNQVFENANFSQVLPHTVVCAGITGLVFRNCNLLNCDVPADAVIESCLTVHKSFCSHLHPELIEKGLPECTTECQHMASKEPIEVDGVVIETIYTYEDLIV